MTLLGMVKRLGLLALLLVVPSLAWAQGQYTNILSSPEPLPNCAPATTNQRQPMIWDTTAQQMKTCTALNTWGAFGGGGGGGTPGAPNFSLQANSGGSFVGLALGNTGAPLLSGGAGAFAAFGPLNLAGGNTVITGVLPANNMPATTVNSVVNDTNVTGSIAAQILTLSWTGTLAKARTLTTTVYTDQSNTYSAGPQVFPGGDYFAGGVNSQTGTSYTFVAADINKLVTFNNAAATGVTLPRATTAGFTSGAILYVFNIGAGAVTITPTTSTINGNTTIVLNQNQGAFIESDGTNYEAWVSSAPTGGGTVTNVGLQINGGATSGIFTVSGSPVTTSGNLNYNLAGNSGGIPYFSNSTTLSSSTAPAANAVMLWGGAGTAPTGTATDTTVTDVLHATNPRAFGPIVNADLANMTWAAPATGTATSLATFPGGDWFMGGINHQVGASYAFVTTDENKLVTFANAGSVAVTISQATTLGFTAGAYFPVFNVGPGTVTITPTTSTINGLASLALTAGTGGTIYSDGTNYSVLLGGSGSGGFTNPMTTLGDMIAENATPVPARLPGPTSPNGITQSLCSTPSGGIAAFPNWCIPGVAIDKQTGTSYTIPITDDVTFVTGNNAAATAWTGFTLANNYVFSFENLGAGAITYTPASGTVNGNANQIIAKGWFGFHYTDNTNTFMPVMPTAVAFGPTCLNALQWSAPAGTISCGLISLVTGVSGILPFANGGTGTSTQFLLHQFWGNATTAINPPGATFIGASDMSPNTWAAGTGTAQAQIVTLTPSVTALSNGLYFCWRPVAANTGAGPTVAVNGLTATTIVKANGAALAANDIVTSNQACVIYNSTGPQFELQNPQTTPGGGSVTSVGLQINAGASSGIFTVSGSPVTTSGNLNYNISGTSGGIPYFSNGTTLSSSAALTANVLMKGGGAGAAPLSGDIQDVSNLLNSATATTQAVTYAGGQDTNANAALGSVILRGANQTGAGGASSSGGDTLVEGGSNAGTNAASQAGNVELLPGPSTGATQGVQGLLTLNSQYVKGTTSTQWNLECESAAMTVADCAATPSSWLGVAEVVNTNTVQLTKIGSQSPINASAAVTLGDTVCAGGTAGKVTDSGGTATCNNSQGSTVGVVMATAGTWSLPDGTTFTATTTLPLIDMNVAARRAPCDSAGTAGQVCASNGASAPAFSDSWHPMEIPAGNDVKGTAGGGQSADTACGTAPTLTLRNGTNISTGYWQFAASQAVCGQLTIPTEWDSSTLPWVQVNFTQSTATASQTIAFQIQIGCSTTTDDPAFQTAQAFTTTTTGGTANTPYFHTVHLNSTSMTSCAVNQVMNWKLSTTAGSNGGANEELVTIYWPLLVGAAPAAN